MILKITRIKENTYLNICLFILIISTIYFFLCLGFSELVLCDDESTLASLNSTLDKDTIAYNEALSKLHKDIGLFEEAEVRPEKFPDLVQYLRDKANDSWDKASNYLNSIRKTEELISKLDSGFKSKIPEQWLDDFCHQDDDDDDDLN